MFEKLILLGILLILGVLSKNQTIIIVVCVLIGLVLLRLSDHQLTTIKNFSIKYGIILLTIYAFIPVAKGDITYHDLIKSILMWRAWIAVFAGILVTYFAKNGIKIMDDSPDVTTFVIVGVIIGLVAFKGVATGPLIGSGIALLMYRIIDFIIAIIK